MDKARSLHADELAPADFEQAQKAWTRALTVAKEGNADTAKVLFVSAKIYFNKSADIAKAKREALFRELGLIQGMIDSSFKEVQRDIAANHLPVRQQVRVQALASDVVEGNAAISKLVSQEDLPKAIATAKDVQKKIYNAQLILAGPR
jgi:hypothetical protein